MTISEMENSEMKKITVAVIAWNVSHNALGRAYMLAEVLSARYNVKLLGFLFEKHGSAVWGPVKDGDIAVDYYPGSNYPGFADTLEAFASRIEADVILACKPRMPSLHLGLLMKALRNRPLLLDIDDYELSFVGKELQKYNKQDLNIPYGKTWTRFAESLISYADQLLVSGATLQEKYGGTIIPHARNEEIFNPEIYSKEKRRSELGISLTDKIVLFLGTPRRHKGLFELLDAIKAFDNASYKLCIMGSFSDSELKEQLQARAGEQLLLFPDQPFKEIAENLAVADAVCLLQDVDSEISKYQLPAKVIDAIAMGIPVLALQTPPLKPLIEQEMVVPTSIESLPRDLENVLSNTEKLREKQIEKRPIFLKEYSYGAIAEKMERIIEKCLENPKPLSSGALILINMQLEVVDHANKLLQNAQERNKALSATIKNLKKEVKVAERKKEFVEQKYKAILQSRAWRYTLPFRRLADLCKFLSWRLKG